MLVNKLGVNVLLLMLSRLRFCKSFQSDNYELVLVIKVQFLYVIHQVDY